MKKPIAIGVAGFGLGVAATALVAVAPAGRQGPSRFFAALREAPPLDAAAAAGAPRAEDGREILHWRAPMDPSYTSDRPGKSPMGMDLVPVYADETGSPPPGTVRIDPGFAQSIGVRTAPVTRRDVAQTIRTVGTLAHNDRQITWVNTKYDGWIENVAVNYLGETVEAGQVLFDVYSPRLVTAQMEYLQALDYAARIAASEYPAIAERARSLVASSRARLRYWDVTDEQIETLERERTPRRSLSVRSPVTGVVVEKMDRALDGLHVRAGANLYQLADLTTIWVDVEVFEHQVAALRVGQRARVELPYLPGRPYTGFVRYLYPHFDERTRTMTVSVELENPGLALRAGMYANVTFDVPVARNALALPEEAVLRGGARDLVVLERAPGTFEVAAVTLGRYGGGVWEALDGVAEGDTIVVSAQFLIDSESNLTQAVRAIDPGAGAPAPPNAHRHGGEHPTTAGARNVPPATDAHRHGGEHVPATAGARNVPAPTDAHRHGGEHVPTTTGARNVPAPTAAHRHGEEHTPTPTTPRNEWTMPAATDGHRHGREHTPAPRDGRDHAPAATDAHRH